jgi:hypothetical protein
MATGYAIHAFQLVHHDPFVATVIKPKVLGPAILSNDTSVNMRYGAVSTQYPVCIRDDLRQRAGFLVYYDSEARTEINVPRWRIYSEDLEMTQTAPPY